MLVKTYFDFQTLWTRLWTPSSIWFWGKIFWTPFLSFFCLRPLPKKCLRSEILLTLIGIRRVSWVWGISRVRGVRRFRGVNGVRRVRGGWFKSSYSDFEWFCNMERERRRGSLPHTSMKKNSAAKKENIYLLAIFCDIYTHEY